MAKTNFSLDFDGFLDLAAQIDEIGGEKALKKATESALNESKKHIQAEIEKFMYMSPYSFTAGYRRSKGRARASLDKISEIPVQWEGTTAKAYIGVDLEEAPEVAILIYGSPHIKPDKKLYKAIKVKGNLRKEVSKIQKLNFAAALLWEKEMKR